MINRAPVLKYHGDVMMTRCPEGHYSAMKLAWSKNSKCVHHHTRRCFGWPCCAVVNNDRVRQVRQAMCHIRRSPGGAVCATNVRSRWRLDSEWWHCYRLDIAEGAPFRSTRPECTHRDGSPLWFCVDLYNTVDENCWNDSKMKTIPDHLGTSRRTIGRKAPVAHCLEWPSCCAIAHNLEWLSRTTNKY